MNGGGIPWSYTRSVLIWTNELPLEEVMQLLHLRILRLGFFQNQVVGSETDWQQGQKSQQCFSAGVGLGSV
jgi:hypothetical protein